MHKVSKRLMRLFALLILLLAGRRPVDALDPATISAIAGTISAGVSLAGTTADAILNRMSGSIAITLKIENFSRYPLRSPVTVVEYGQIAQWPLTVAAGSSEVIKAQKSSRSYHGTTGCASWLVDDGRCGRGDCTRIYTMWSIPYRHNQYLNRLTVGARERTRNDRDIDCYSMYHRPSSWYIRGDYQTVLTPVEIMSPDCRFKIMGLMGTDYRVHATIRLIPLHENDWAYHLKEKLRRYREENGRYESENGTMTRCPAPPRSPGIWKAACSPLMGCIEGVFNKVDVNSPTDGI